MMNKERYGLLNRNFFLAVLFLAVGIAAALSMLRWGVQGLNTGLFCGFFPTGLGCLIIELKTAKSAELQKKAVIENEERNQFIRAKAGQGALFISYAAVFLLWLAAQAVQFNAVFLTIVLLVLMPIVYFVLIGVFSRKY